MKDKSLESIFRQKLEDLSIEPSDRAKDLIRLRIKKRGRIILYRKLSIAASILLIITSGIFYLVPEKEENTLAGEMETAGEKRDLIVDKDTAENREIMEVPQVAQSPYRDNREAQPMQDSEREESGKSTPPIQENAGAIDKIDKDVYFPIIVATGDSPEEKPNSLRIASLENQFPPENTYEEKINLHPIEAPELLSDVSTDETSEAEESTKITIEYIASGSKGKEAGASKTQVGELYSKVNKLVYPDEVLGNIRSLKDQLFAFEFINRKSTHTQNNKEK
jgi:hypothetical protein